jgi:hypothetical protein
VPSTSHSRWRYADTTALTLIHWCSVGSTGAEDPVAKSSLLAFTRPSDRPTLPFDQGVGSSGAEDFFLARLYLDSNWASDRPTVSSLRPSDHPVLLSLLLFLCNSSDATRKWTVSSSNGVNFISASTQCTKCFNACTDSTVGSSDGFFFLPFLRVFNLDLCFNLTSLTYLTCHYL